MAVLIEKQWADTDEGYVEDTAIVASAILPSGKILLSPDVYSDQYAAASFKQAINEFMSRADEGADPMSDNGIFRLAAYYHRSGTFGDFYLIEDPQEARQIIQEAGLK